MQQRPTGYPEARFRTEVGLLDGVGLLGTGSVAERLWSRPAATVLAIDAPPVAAASNTLTATARAKVGLRLAPGDDARRAGRALARHLHERAPWGVQVVVTDGDISEPYAVDTRRPAHEAARTAFGAAYGKPLVEIGAGPWSTARSLASAAPR